MPAIAQRRGTGAGGHEDTVSCALEQLLSRLSAVVRQAAQRHGASESDIDEVFQDVRIRLWRALSTGENISTAPASYVHRTAISATLDLIRRRRTRREEAIDGIGDRFPATGAQPDQAAEAAEMAIRLGRALAVLRESRRVVVRLYLIGYDRHEIAKLLGWTEAKTRNLLYRGLSDLKASLGERPIRKVTVG